MLHQIYSPSYNPVSPWTGSSCLTERQDSRLVPSPTKAAAASSADLVWPSLYGSTAPPAFEYNKDAFLGQYIHRIYCRECRDQESMAAASGSNSAGQPDSPPQYQMDQMSLAGSAMDVNKQALGRKLQLRRSMNELVDQGIYPSHPAAFATERRHLQIAQTGDKLKHKIQCRPDRDFLVQHHILEDSNVDPSLQSTRRKLKKAKLTDELNEKLAHRPGPLELVEQHILEAEDPIVDAIKESKLEYHKTQEGVEPSQIPKLPYEVESPKSGTSSPEPIDCDNDSNNSSNVSTGFSHVPSPPDITPLLKQPSHITIGGHTIPITTQSLCAPSTLSTVAIPQHKFTSNILSVSQPYQAPVIALPQRSSSIGATRSNRKVSKQSRPKQQAKQRIIKFHEYKGPSTSSNNKTSSGPSTGNSYSSSAGSFVTTTGPLQKLDTLTPYQMRLQQQQLYLQCQLEVQSKGTLPATVFVPVQPAPSPLPITKKEQDLSSPPPPPPPAPKSDSSSGVKSRPVTPALKSPPPTSIAPSTPLHISQSMSNLEDLKVADLKAELKQRNLPVSGSKPQLIERLRAHQLQEMSTNVPSVSSYSDISSYGNIPSVQSFSDESFVAPSSVKSVTRHSSPPMSPLDDLRAPASVSSSKYQDMETDETSQGIKTTEEIVREQARRIEELQRALIQSQQQLQMVQVHQPYVTTQSQPTVTQAVINPSLQKSTSIVQSPIIPVTTTATAVTPVDITNKQVYVTTPDGKVTAYKVVMHTGNGLLQSLSSPAAAPQASTSSNCFPAETVTMATHNLPTDQSLNLQQQQQHQQPQQHLKNIPAGCGNANIDVDDVLEVLYRTGELDPHNLGQSNKNKVITPSFSSMANNQAVFAPSINLNISNNAVNADDAEPDLTAQLNDLPLEPALSPLADMDWIGTDSSNHYLDGLTTDDTVRNHDSSAVDQIRFDDNCNLDWLSDVMQLDSNHPSDSTTNFGNNRQQQHLAQTSYGVNDSLLSIHTNSFSTADPVLGQKSHDVLNIFNMDDSDVRPSTTVSSHTGWE